MHLLYKYSTILVVSGSPAEKADLEVADEILEINGQSLDNSNHTDVITHIHNVSYPSFQRLLQGKNKLSQTFSFPLYIFTTLWFSFTFFLKHVFKSKNFSYLLKATKGELSQNPKDNTIISTFFVNQQNSNLVSSIAQRSCWCDFFVRKIFCVTSKYYISVYQISHNLPPGKAQDRQQAR